MGSSTTAWGRPLAMWSARQQSAAPGDFWRYVPSSGGLAIDGLKQLIDYCQNLKHYINSFVYLYIYNIKYKYERK